MCCFYEAPGPPLGMLPGPPTGTGTLGLMVVMVGAGAAPPPGPPTGIGTFGLIGVIPGLVGGMGIMGVPGTMGLTGVPPPGAGGANAAMLLVRKATFVPRAFNGLVPGADIPPAAGSISSSQAPHLRTEST